MNEMFFVVCKDAVFLLLVTGLAVVVSASVLFYALILIFYLTIFCKGNNNESRRTQKNDRKTLK